MAPHQKSTCQEFMKKHKFIFSNLIFARTHQRGQQAIVTVKAFFLGKLWQFTRGRRRWCHCCFCKLSAAPHFYLEFQLSTFLGHSPLSLGHSATECRLDCKMAIFFTKNQFLHGPLALLKFPWFQILILILSVGQHSDFPLREKWKSGLGGCNLAAMQETLPVLPTVSWQEMIQKYYFTWQASFDEKSKKQRLPLKTFYLAKLVQF